MLLLGEGEYCAVQGWVVYIKGLEFGEIMRCGLITVQIFHFNAIFVSQPIRKFTQSDNGFSFLDTQAGPSLEEEDGSPPLDLAILENNKKVSIRPSSHPQCMVMQNLCEMFLNCIPQNLKHKSIFYFKKIHFLNFQLFKRLILYKVLTLTAFTFV